MATDPGSLWPDVTKCLPEVEATLGAPAYQDDQIVVFGLTKRRP